MKKCLCTDHILIEKQHQTSIQNIDHISYGIMIIYQACCISYLSNLHHLGQPEAVIFHPSSCEKPQLLTDLNDAHLTDKHTLYQLPTFENNIFFL